MDGVNRRLWMSAMTAVGAAASQMIAHSPQALAGGHLVDVRGTIRRQGVQGRMTGAQAIVGALECMGTPAVYGIPGAQNNELWDAFKAAQLPYLLVSHEFSCSVMADASARVTGWPGVYSVIPGPGITNAMSGMGEALLDSIPIVGIVTDVDTRPGAPIGQVHSLANVHMLQTVNKAVLVAEHVSQLPGLVYQAFHTAIAGEPGPVAVVVPYYMMTDAFDFDDAPPPLPGVPWDENAYAQAMSLLADRKRRIGIYAGIGCQDASAELIAAAELMQAPVATSVSGKGSMPESHPLSVGWGYGAYGTKTAERRFAEVDVVLAVGVKYSEVSTANFAVPDHPCVIHVDANPNNIGRNVKTAVGVNADARVFLQRLLADGANVARQRDEKLLRTIARERQADHAEYHSVQVQAAVDPMLFLTELNGAIGPEAMAFIDVTAATHWAAESFVVSGPRRYFAPANNQSMGWAVPASIGAQFVQPGRLTVCVTGDGCFLMSGMELSTAARTGLPVKFFILDDGAYHYMQMLQEPVYRRTTATEIASINHAAFAAAMGVAYNEITHNQDISAGILRALCTPGPVLTKICVSYEGRDIRWLSALRKKYLNGLERDDKVRMARRVVRRTIEIRKEND
jgi:acetolactate synthase-1/2/3 large subunit